VALNRANWDERALIHAQDRTGFYRIAEFKAGADTLTPIEAAELGDVGGLRILHLQCHLGLDSLSLVRRGARVTGLDFSENAIAFARELSSTTGLAATFILADVSDVRTAVIGEFDLVYATWGVLCWIPDARLWLNNAASMLTPGGRLYLADDHPNAAQAAQVQFANGESALIVADPWRTAAEAPLMEEDPHTYTGDATKLEHAATCEWIHPLSEIVSGVLDAGMMLEFFHEHDRIPYRRWSAMERAGDVLWRLPTEIPGPPLAFSLAAVRECRNED